MIENSLKMILFLESHWIFTRRYLNSIDKTMNARDYVYVKVTTEV